MEDYIKRYLVEQIKLQQKLDLLFTLTISVFSRLLGKQFVLDFIELWMKASANMNIDNIPLEHVELWSQATWSVYNEAMTKLTHIPENKQ